MAIDTLKKALPGYAKDLKLNLGSLRRNSSLTDQQIAGTMLASAIASRNPLVTRAIRDEVADDLDEAGLDAAKAAAAIMGMNNVYYRFLHLVEKPEYQQMPAKLRMNVIANPGVDKADFELWSLAVSAVNGCGMCVASHEKVVTDAGLSKEAVQDAVKVASVIHAVAVTLEAEDALAEAPTSEDVEAA